MKKIPLTGFRNHKEVTVDYAIVDDDDYYILKMYSWYKTDLGYARTSFIEKGKKVYLTMHKEIMRPQNGLVVDHINGNRLDNRKENLRVCTQQQNTWNKAPMKNKKYSKVAGVTYCKDHSRWRAGIWENGKLKLIGYYKNESDAISARVEYAKKLHGEFFRNPD